MSAAENAWQQRGACNGAATALFFPENAADTEAAKAICETCPVKDACLDHALANNEPGIWGGTTGWERRRMKRRMGQPLAKTACEECGTVFQKRSNGHKACSEECATALQRRWQKAWEMSRG